MELGSNVLEYLDGDEVKWAGKFGLNWIGIINVKISIWSSSLVGCNIWMEMESSGMDHFY
jgi:hypothetical protein